MVHRIAVNKLEHFIAYAREKELNANPQGGEPEMVESTERNGHLEGCLILLQ